MYRLLTLDVRRTCWWLGEHFALTHTYPQQSTSSNLAASSRAENVERQRLQDTDRIVEATMLEPKATILAREQYMRRE